MASQCPQYQNAFAHHPDAAAMTQSSSRTAALLLLVLVVAATNLILSAVAQVHRQRCCGKQRDHDGGGNGRYRFSLDRNLHRRFRGGRVKRPEYYGSGCPTNSLAHVNSSDETSVALSVLFSAFQAQTTDSALRDQKECFINVELNVEPVRLCRLVSSERKNTSLLASVSHLLVSSCGQHRACRSALCTSTFAALRTCQKTTRPSRH